MAPPFRPSSRELRFGGPSASKLNQRDVMSVHRVDVISFQGDAKNGETKQKIEGSELLGE